MESQAAEYVRAFLNSYGKIHGPLVVAICFFGAFANLLNIVVLTRRSMRGPTNVLLTGLSVAQLMLLCNYLVYTIYGILDSECSPSTKSFGWLSYLLMNVNLNLVFHTIALVHTTFLSIFRYLAVAFPTRCKQLVSVVGAKRVVMVAFIAVPIVCTTFYPNSNVVPIINSTGNWSDCDDWPDGWLNSYTLRYNTDLEALQNYNFGFFGTVCKLLPCAIIITLSTLLIKHLKEVQRRKWRLKFGGSTNNNLTGGGGGGGGQQNVCSDQQHRQVTIMLVCVALLFVVVELPQGIMNMLSAFLKDDFLLLYTDCGDLFEMLTVLYSSLNFILYCTMSSQFRATFKQLFCLFSCRRKDAKENGEMLECYNETAGLTRVLVDSRT